MATRRTVYINKIKQGSKFRTLAGTLRAGTRSVTKYTYPKFPKFLNISVNSNWINENVNWFLQGTNFTFSTHVPGQATDAEIVEFWNPTITIIPANVMTFIFGSPKTSHYIGTLNQSGNIVRP